MGRCLWIIYMHAQLYFILMQCTTESDVTTHDYRNLNQLVCIECNRWWLDTEHAMILITYTPQILCCICTSYTACMHGHDLPCTQAL